MNTLVILLYIIFLFIIIKLTIIKYDRDIFIFKQSNKKHVIFSLALDYEWKNIKYFIISLRKSGYNGSIVLLVEENSTLINNTILNNLNTSFIYITKKYPYISEKNSYYYFNITEAKRNMVLNHKFKFTVYRHIIIKLWMDSYLDYFDYYGILDIRDVVFQRNPFDFHIKKGVYLFEEAINYPIKYQTKMVEWISVYENWKKVSNNPIINSGITIGTKYEIYKFYKIYIKLLFNSTTASQGTLNFYYYNGIFKPIPIYIFKNGFGLALHFHVEYIDKKNKEKFYPPQNNCFVNKDSSIPAIIHQYDRIGYNNLINYLKYYNNL